MFVGYKKTRRRCYEQLRTVACQAEISRWRHQRRLADESRYINTATINREPIRQVNPGEPAASIPVLRDRLGNEIQDVFEAFIFRFVGIAVQNIDFSAFPRHVLPF
jgi:hypothetical protein